MFEKLVVLYQAFNLRWSPPFAHSRWPHLTKSAPGCSKSAVIPVIVWRWVSHPSKPVVVFLFLTMPSPSLWNTGNISKLGRPLPIALFLTLCMCLSMPWSFFNKPKEYDICTFFCNHCYKTTLDWELRGVEELLANIIWIAP